MIVQLLCDSSVVFEGLIPECCPFQEPLQLQLFYLFLGISLKAAIQPEIIT